ncbi:tyrosine-type recombinase/integrase [Heyndrickxia oleronia]|uniref:Site-specific integrase n=1 Tax=Heyndrickxia oleronia TaxID=38875 RepID=A0AAW6T0J9_9BACI|nr:site-specific integrase [Heyndrickxia oleronia]MDH5164531.1 site-specific integrase [Heyndrickxia oleronia]
MAEKTAKGKSSIMQQFEKTFRHTRSNSFGTRGRYKSSCRKFIEFLNEKFKLKNLKNLHDKHLVSYIEYRQDQGVAAKTLKNDLAAIRFMHDMLPEAKYTLSDNDGLKKNYSISLDKTPAIKGDRAWTNEEYRKMQKLALEVYRDNGTGARTAKDVHSVMTLCRTMGLRVTEAVAMTRSQAEQALRTGVYQVKNEAKNGKWRQVPVSMAARNVLEKKLRETPRGGRFFVRENEKTHRAVNRIEKFLYNNRKKIETQEGVELRTWQKDGVTHINELTFHGLRYAYVQDRVQQEIGKGFTAEQAAQRVTKEVGHERTDVIYVYLAKKNKKDKKNK